MIQNNFKLIALVLVLDLMSDYYSHSASSVKVVFWRPPIQNVENLVHQIVHNFPKLRCVDRILIISSISEIITRLKFNLVRPKSPNKSKQWLYHIHTVTIESHDERRFWTKSLALSENECVSV